MIRAVLLGLYWLRQFQSDATRWSPKSKKNSTNYYKN